jgi:hypothetical protein
MQRGMKHVERLGAKTLVIERGVSCRNFVKRNLSSANETSSQLMNCCGSWTMPFDFRGSADLLISPAG